MMQQQDEAAGGLPDGAEELDGGRVRLPLVGNPIKAHGEEVAELIFNPPGVEDLVQVGLPFMFVPAPGGGQGTVIQQPVVAQHIQRLARVPRNSVMSLGLADFSRATAVVMHFFGQAQGGGQDKTPAKP